MLVPWHHRYQVPAGKVLCTWRAAPGPAPLAGPQARLLAAAGAEHRDHDYRAVCPGTAAMSCTRAPSTGRPDLGPGPQFPCADRVARILAAGTRVLIRVKSGIALPRISGFLPDGSYYSYLAGGPAAGRWCLKVRVIEYQVDVDGQDTGETFCLISDLLDHVARRPVSSPPPAPGGGPGRRPP